MVLFSVIGLSLCVLWMGTAHPPQHRTDLFRQSITSTTKPATSASGASDFVPWPVGDEHLIDPQHMRSLPKSPFRVIYHRAPEQLPAPEAEGKAEEAEWIRSNGWSTRRPASVPQIVVPTRSKEYTIEGIPKDVHPGLVGARNAGGRLRFLSVFKGFVFAPKL